MTIITVANSKGGVGKSTLAGNLAVMSAAENNRTLLIDADPQKSALNFRNRREADDITAIAPSGKIRSDLKSLEDSFDVAIIDCGGHNSNLLVEAMGLAHLLIVPVEPGQAEYDSLETLLAQISPICDAKQSIGAPFAARLLLNRVVSGAAIGRDFRDALDGFAEMVPTIKPQLGQRTDFKYAHAAGLGIGEYANSSQAAAEVRRVWKEIKLILEAL